MHDIKLIRNDPEDFDKSMINRNVDPISHEIIKLDKEIRSLKTQSQEVQEKRNSLSKKIGFILKEKKDPKEIQNEVKSLKTKLINFENSINEKESNLDKILKVLPNLLDKDVPIGKNDLDNKLIKKWGQIPEFSFHPKDHVELGEKNNQIDFKTAGKISGSRFVLMRGEAALLERALISFMLDVNINEFGHEEIMPPYLVNSRSLIGTGQLPKFSNDLFKTSNDKWLIPTSEVPLTNIVSNEILEEKDLPFNFVAYSPCFRSEAGAAGKDTRGMIRQHQFSKVELVSITKEDESEKELERMLSCATSILDDLKIPYQVILLSSGDMGFSAEKTYDIEVWLPGEGKYREISSCSNCNSFQARRMNARYKDSDQNKFVHTLNGSGLAVGRTLIAILENYQNEDGSISIPQVLKPYMGNLDKISK